MTKQARWARERVAEGLCRICGRLREHYRSRCDACARRDRERQRAKFGFQPRRAFRADRPQPASPQRPIAPSTPVVDVFAQLMRVRYGCVREYGSRGHANGHEGMKPLAGSGGDGQ